VSLTDGAVLVGGAANVEAWFDACIFSEYAVYCVLYVLCAVCSVLYAVYAVCCLFVCIFGYCDFEEVSLRRSHAHRY